MGQRCDLASQLADWKGTADQQSGEAQQMERSSLALLQTASLRIRCSLLMFLSVATVQCPMESSYKCSKGKGKYQLQITAQTPPRTP